MFRTRSLLRKAMAGNAAFSTLSGVVALAGSGRLAERLGVDTWFLALLGAGLIGYGALLFIWLRGDERLAAAGTSAVLADAIWVIGAVVVLVGFPDALTEAGRWTLAIVSVLVADFAVLQFLGVRRERAGGPTPTEPVGTLQA